MITHPFIQLFDVNRSVTKRNLFHDAQRIEQSHRSTVIDVLQKLVSKGLKKFLNDINETDTHAIELLFDIINTRYTDTYTDTDTDTADTNTNDIIDNSSITNPTQIDIDTAFEEIINQPDIMPSIFQYLQINELNQCSLVNSIWLHKSFNINSIYCLNSFRVNFSQVLNSKASTKIINLSHNHRIWQRFINIRH